MSRLLSALVFSQSPLASRIHKWLHRSKATSCVMCRAVWSRLDPSPKNYATVEKFADYVEPAPARPDVLAVLERITVVADRRPAHRGKVVSHDLEEVHSPDDPCDICAAIAALRSERQP